MRNYLKQLRVNNNLSQQTMANKLGMTQQYYGFIENGERQKDLDLSLVLSLSKIFNVSVDYIINEEEKLKTGGE